MVMELGVEPHEAKSVWDVVTVGWSPARVRVTGPASGPHVKWTVVVALPGDVKARVM